MLIACFFFLFHFLTIILIVQLTIYVTALALNLFPVTEGGWISTPSWATIMNSRITFTVCLAAAVSNVTSHVSSDTVGCTSIVVCTFLPTYQNIQNIKEALILINRYSNPLKVVIIDYIFKDFNQQYIVLKFIISGYNK